MAKIGCIYFLQMQNQDGYVKIGFSKDVVTRQKDLQVGSPYPVKLLALLINESHTTEFTIHKILQNSRIRGEWFYYSDEVKECIEFVLANNFNGFIEKYLNICKTNIKYDFSS